MTEYDIITSRQNEQLKLIGKLRQKRVRDELDLFIIEGKKLILEALKSKAVIEKVFLSERLKDTEIIKNLSQAGLNSEVVWVKHSLFDSFSEMKNPEGVLALVKKLKPGANPGKRYIILEDVQDPNNVGTIIRTADAAGFDSIIATLKTADFYNEKVVRGSMGSIFHLNLETTNHINDTITELKKSGVIIIGTALDGKNIFEQTTNFSSFALVLGNESRGMSGDLKAKCEHLYQIPIYGQAESLNVAVAAGIVMYQLAK
ncbi:RNA methyltransferase [Eubacteriaceae bacterium ES3]|nr:RNA methyltransferase [Eubacteriaceae bacterium ES3]